MDSSSSNDGCNTLQYTLAAAVGSFLGTFGSVTLIMTSIRHNVMKSMSRHIIMMISLADILQAFPVLVVSLIQIYEKKKNNDDILDWMGEKKCKWQAAVVTVGAMLTFLWTFGLSQHIYLLLRFGIKVAHRAYIGLHVLSIIPVAIMTASFCYDVLGIDEKTQTESHLLNWCWIKVTNESDSGPFLKKPCPAAMWNGKGFEIFAYIGVTVYCTLAWRQYQRLMEDNTINGDGSGVLTSGNDNPFTSGSNLRINKILLIPILFIVCRIWGTIQRLSCYCFLSHLDSVCTSHILIALLNFFDPLQGFVNFLLFTILSQNNCRCDCLTIVRANIQRPQHLTSAEPVTVYVQRESSDSSQF